MTGGTSCAPVSMTTKNGQFEFIIDVKHLALFICKNRYFPGKKKKKLPAATKKASEIVMIETEQNGFFKKRPVFIRHKV